MNSHQHFASWRQLGLAWLLIIWIATPLLPQSLTLSLPDTVTSANSLLKIPVRTSDVTGLGITSVALTITFDENVLDALGANSLGTLSQAWGNPLATDKPGRIELLLRGSAPLA
ncbi:MAG: hypothetical protein ONB16_07295, partial [candidate division KSB1 bacterium]|nr:hypothetical protein [candidate division KSB1 bacterium]